MSITKTFALISMTAILVTPLALRTAEAGANCHCRTAIGEKVQVGNFTCLKTNSGLKEARCEFVLNNTAWKLTGNSCPSARLDHIGEDDRILSLALIDFTNSAQKR